MRNENSEQVIVAASSPKKWKVFAEIIKLYQGTEYSHVLLIKNGMVYQANYRGAHKESLSSFLKENKIVWFKSVPDRLVDWDFVNKSIKNKTPYGFTQIAAKALKVLTGIIFREPENKRLICSEFVGKTFRIKWVNDFTTPEEIVEYFISRS